MQIVLSKSYSKTRAISFWLSPTINTNLFEVIIFLVTPVISATISNSNQVRISYASKYKNYYHNTELCWMSHQAVLLNWARANLFQARMNHYFWLKLYQVRHGHKNKKIQFFPIGKSSILGLNSITISTSWDTDVSSSKSAKMIIAGLISISTASKISVI